MKRIIFIAMMLILVATFVQCGGAKPKITAAPLEYTQGDKTFEGFLAYDENATGKRPAVLVIHAWMGLDDYAKNRAKQLAELGYVAFAMDVYGKGIRAKDHDEAGQLMGQYAGDRDLLRSRMDRALEVLRENPNVDPNKIAAIGYCFGGMSVIELALSGADVEGVVSFHGVLMSPNLESGVSNVKAPIQIHHGADDSFTPAEQVNAMKTTLEEAENVKLEWYEYPGAVHAFTVEAAGDDPSDGLAYNKAADEKSWARMKEFLNDVL